MVFSSSQIKSNMYIIDKAITQGGLQILKYLFLTQQIIISH